MHLLFLFNDALIGLAGYIMDNVVSKIHFLRNFLMRAHCAGVLNQHTFDTYSHWVHS